jgi:general secretion pathway protein I
MSIQTGKSCFGEQGPIAAAGFTLLEVMIAVSLIAIALVTLIGSQSQSIAIATGSRFDAMAALLAQRQLAEICLQEYAAVNDGEGDFGEEHPGFRWKTKITELTEAETGVKGAGGMLKAVDLTIALRGDEELSYSLRTILLRSGGISP